jgi:hypothetical protein
MKHLISCLSAVFRHPIGCLLLLVACGGEGEKPSTRTTVTGPKGEQGEQGPAGENGKPCEATQYEGYVELKCPDSEPVIIQDGADGFNGTSCTVSEVFDDEGKSLGGLIECEDGSSVFIKHGEDSKKGKGK